ncbi:carboxymuconolactone decarboxylase family protein [Chitinophaga defluvii]|uniref:Carboxymuconolactone decarboxylase family protein n=1 Tax=Chitinophaga defluvii TaxID=3163343 RepID=A0ABV2TBN9_9BACT
MKPRLKMMTVQPAAYQAISALEKYLSTTSIPKLHKELIKIRASQINGCAFCVNMHVQDALKMGETVQRISLIPVWREAPNAFNEEEQLLLAMTEEVTLISQHGLSDELYDKSIALFGEEKTAQIIMAIATINVWNRTGVAFHLLPEL